MKKVVCTLPNASELINGVKFAEEDGVMVSVEVEDDVAEQFASIPGYELRDVAEKAAAKSGKKSTAKAETAPAGDTPPADQPPAEHNGEQAPTA